MPQIKTKELLNGHPFKVKDEVITDIWYKLNQAALSKIVESGGQPFEFYGRFGHIKINRRKRKIKLKEGKPILSVNWAQTKKQRANGTLDPDKFIYHIYPFTYTFVWGGRECANQSVYKYVPSRSNGVASMSGAINKLWEFINENDTNYMKFPLKS